ncbi:kinase to dihydroxyacetone kinase [Gemmiger sp.]
MENKFDTQFLIEGHDLDEDVIHDGILNSAKGDCLLVVGDEDVVKVHYHTDTPWKVLEYAAALGELNTIIVENMERQAKGLHG